MNRLFKASNLRWFTTPPPSPPSPHSPPPQLQLLQKELPGSAPSHLCYIFLHTPQPPAEYPARYSTAVQRALLVKTSKWGGSVNFSWARDQPVVPVVSEDAQERQHEGGGAETYYLTAFSSRGQLVIPRMSLANVDEVEIQLREHAQPPEPTRLDLKEEEVHVYVCTHGARDCRCGNTGGAVANALREELQRRDERRVKVAETGHVGGHKYAANVLIYPQGEWLGLVQPDDVPSILDTILATPPRPLGPNEAPLCPPHWRGRMGLSKAEQRELFSSYHDTS